MQQYLFMNLWIWWRLSTATCIYFLSFQSIFQCLLVGNQLHHLFKSFFFLGVLMFSYWSLMATVFFSSILQHIKHLWWSKCALFKDLCARNALWVVITIVKWTSSENICSLLCIEQSILFKLVHSSSAVFLFCSMFNYSLRCYDHRSSCQFMFSLVLHVVILILVSPVIA